jgi:hypothetical protein
MDCAVGMFGWRVQRVELDLVVPGVDHVVPDPGWDDECPIVFDLVRLVDCIFGSPELDTGLASFETDELIVGAV